MKKIINWNNNFINVFLTILVGISILGSFTQILPNYLKLSSTDIIIINWLIVLITILFLARKSTLKYMHFFYTFISSDSRIFKPIFAIIIISWQCWFVSSLVGGTSWDPTGLLARVVETPNLPFNASDYISIYPNNFLLFLFEKAVWIIFNKPTIEQLTLILAMFNIILVDTALFLTAKTIKKLFNKFTAFIYQVLSLSLIVLSPWISVPYSDIWGYFLSSISIYLTISLFYVTKNWQKIMYSFLIGLCFSVSYFIKPSLIIFYIALAIVLLITLTARKRKISPIAITTITLSALVICLTFSIFKKNNSIVTIDENQTFSMVHFAAMGATKKGGYNPTDFEADQAIKNPDKRQKRDINVLRKRIQSFEKLTNYQRFLFQKQIYNTSDGTFTWGYSGSSSKFYYPKNNYPQRLFADKRFINKDELLTLFIQVIWTTSLIFILFTLTDKRLFVQVLKYSVVGFFVFLLIFEGGRSRYLIQSLPFLILLSSIGANKLLLYSKKQRH